MSRSFQSRAERIKMLVVAVLDTGVSDILRGFP